MAVSCSRKAALRSTRSGRTRLTMRGSGDCAAIAGYGVAQLPYQAAGAPIKDGRLRRVLGAYTTPVGGLYAVYPSSRHVSPLVKAFIELAAARLAAIGTGEDRQGLSRIQLTLRRTG
jgi:DNA-binding transcriptional LysR family regulator